MKSDVMEFAVVLGFSVLLVLIPVASESAASQDVSNAKEQASWELLIGWREGVSEAERDRIIAELGGKLKRHFTLIAADSVLFDSEFMRETAVQDAGKYHAVRQLHQVNIPTFDTPTVGIEEDNSIPDYSMSPNADSGARSEFPKGNSILRDDYTKRFPYNHWRYFNRIHESQEFAQQKQEVIVALIGDSMELSPYLRGVIWENEAEKNGEPGIDDDRNGWVDDINGINPIDAPETDKYTVTREVSELLAGAANYARGRLHDPKGLVKIMPITAFSNPFNYRKSISPSSFLTTNVSALIESIEYAAIMGAKIIFIPGYYCLSSGDQTLVDEAAAAFPGLIITCRLISRYHFIESLIRFAKGLDNCIAVGGYLHSLYRGEPEGPIDLSALIEHPSYTLYSTGGMVTGVAAHLMSCYPHLDRYQVRDLLLATVDEQSYSLFLFKSNSSGLLNAVRAVLGRSAGGSLYIGDWARIDRDGPPPRKDFLLAYDSLRGRIYLYGGTDPIDYYTHYDDFWVWDGVAWNKIRQDRREGHYPGFVRNSIFKYDQKRDRLVLIDKYSEAWIWNGTRWSVYETAYPDYLDPNRGPRGQYAVYDPNDDCLLLPFYSSKYKPNPKKYSSILLEFDWNRWKTIKTYGDRPKNYSPLIYNSRTKQVTFFEDVPPGKLFTKALWVYHNLGWRRKKIAPILGEGKITVFDSTHGWYLRVGSNRALDISRYNGRRWRTLGFDMPYLASYSQGFWAEDRQKLMIVGERGVFTNAHGIGAKGLSIWQYSGAIKPTWIDNLIIPQSDYDGDGKADLALWHPGTGEFRLQNGTIATFGKRGDIPVPGNYYIDGKIEFAVCRRVPDPKRRWDVGKLVWISENNTVNLGQFDDIPVPADYDGDGRSDFAVFRKDTAKWIFRFHGADWVRDFGNPADLPVPADYDGDGRADLATYTPLTSTWHIQGIGDIQYGEPGDSPVPADYDGDGRADIATWNPRKRLWLVRDWSGGNMIRQHFGAKWDIPVPGDYDGDGAVELATYSPITSLWKIHGRPPVKFGTAGDVPLVRGN